MAFIADDELVGRMPQPTRLTPDEADGFIKAAIARIASNHTPEKAPDNAITREMVEELSYAKAIRRHYIKGEAEIDTEPFDKEIARVEKRFDAYDQIHQSENEATTVVPAGYVMELPY